MGRGDSFYYFININIIIILERSKTRAWHTILLNALNGHYIQSKIFRILFKLNIDFGFYITTDFLDESADDLN